MKIAVASGKGGTGKTTLAVNLAMYAAQSENILLADIDVEEPNSAIFVKGELLHKQEMYRMVPQWNENLCTYCGRCPSWCNFNSLLKLGDSITVLKNLCHSCYACSELCPSNALPMVEEPLGVLTQKRNRNLLFVESKLNVGVEMAVPLISQTISFMHKFDGGKLQIWDSPPGTSCPVIEATNNADFVILVSEPTPFGLHDLRLTVETMRYLSKPMAVVVNRYGIGNEDLIKYCEESNLPIWAKIPNRREIAEFYSEGETVYDKIPEVQKALKNILQQINVKRRDLCVK